MYGFVIGKFLTGTTKPTLTTTWQPSPSLACGERMIVVADSSPLRYLIVINLQDLLPALFGETLVPTEVLRELSSPSTPVVVSRFVKDRPAWLLVRDPKPEMVQQVSVDLDVGERAALALARELGADLILMDDAAGRREAQTLRLRMTGTIGVLRLAAERGLVDVPMAVANLRESGFYLDEALIRAAFARWL